MLYVARRVVLKPLQFPLDHCSVQLFLLHLPCISPCLLHIFESGTKILSSLFLVLPEVTETEPAELVATLASHVHAATILVDCVATLGAWFRVDLYPVH